MYSARQETHNSGAFRPLLDVQTTLEECIDGHGEVMVLTEGRGPSVHGYLTALDREIVTLRTGPEGGRLTPGTACCVTFYYAGRGCLFMTSVLQEARPVGDGLSIPLRRPAMLNIESRRTVRVPVAPDVDLRARVSSDEGHWSPRVVDLSLGGVRLAFPREVPDWSVGTMVRLDLALDIGVSATLIAVVVRRIGADYGLAFGGPRTRRHGPNTRKLGRLLQILSDRNARDGQSGPFPRGPARTFR